MENPKNEWQDEILNSLDGAKRATPSVDLFSKIEAKLNISPVKTVSISRLVMAAAAAAAILIINFFAISHTADTSPDLNASNWNEVNYFTSDFNIYE